MTTEYEPIRVMSKTIHGAPFSMVVNASMTVSKVETVVGTQYVVTLMDGGKKWEKQINHAAYLIFLAQFRKFRTHYLKRTGFKPPRKDDAD
jgi:hypothetical protein